MEELINKEIENGKVIISEDVICAVAGVAATEVSGVAGMAGGIIGGIVEMIGKKNNGKGVEVEFVDDAVIIDVHFVSKYGVKLTEVCWEIQEKVKKAVEEMCGLQVIKVNVFVDSIFIEKEPKKEAKKEPKK